MGLLLLRQNMLASPSSTLGAIPDLRAQYGIRLRSLSLEKEERPTLPLLLLSPKNICRSVDFTGGRGHHRHRRGSGGGGTRFRAASLPPIWHNSPSPLAADFVGILLADKVGRLRLQRHRPCSPPSPRGALLGGRVTSSLGMEKPCAHVASFVGLATERERECRRRRRRRCIPT